MKMQYLLELLGLFQLITLSQSSHVQHAKQRIQAEVQSALGQQPQHAQYSQQHYHHHHQQQRHHKPQSPYHRHERQYHPPPHFFKHYHGSHWHSGNHVHRLHGHRHQWSGRRHSAERHRFTSWTPWTDCNSDCVKRRERFCKTKRKCGHTKHVEERKCYNCHTHWHLQHESATTPQQHTVQPPAIIINAAAAAATPKIQPTPATIAHEAHKIETSYPELEHTYRPHHGASAFDEASSAEESDFYVLRRRNKSKKPRKLHFPVEFNDYDLDDADDADDANDTDTAGVFAERTASASPAPSTLKLKNHEHSQLSLPKRNLFAGDDGIDGETFQYEDFDFDADVGRGSLNSQYSDSYEESTDYTNSRNNSLLLPTPSRERATPDGLTPRHRRLYSKWSRWTKCSPKCTTRRYKKCRIREQCGREVLREIAYCYTEGSFCQQWLQAQVQKSPPYELRPVAASRRRDIGDNAAQTNNAITSDYIMNSKGYRGPEYTPVKLKCGIAPIRNNRRNMYNMLKIIGGKAVRKGEWPWQVAIFNRFEEAFCGGTLIAPQWVLTAAHCVRKVLYVRLGEHNLGFEEGTEMQLRVHSSFKHPNFDKRTVDSDVALLRLPKPINSTTWIGFSCLPRPFQPLPKNIDCTVIGWGKRRNRDAAGTNLLHQAEVPIIPMDNCRSVYRDYNITKNMFCAGHRRGRIDTCAGDSGGPLLCRDTTKPNHPWTIFGITSFGDGCAKRNKFGIYAKVPNYVDWIWSVINCNGNCKLYQRSYMN